MTTTYYKLLRGDAAAAQLESGDQAKLRVLSVEGDDKERERRSHDQRQALKRIEMFLGLIGRGFPFASEAERQKLAGDALDGISELWTALDELRAIYRG